MEFNTEKELEKFIDSWTDVLDQGLKTQRGLLEIALAPYDLIFEKDINDRVLKVLSSGSYILGQNVKSFENNARNYLATRYTVSCNSGTDALVMSLRALKIGNNDQVITTPFTYFATSEAISLVGATPIFADINPHTFNINPKKIMLFKKWT